MRCGDSLNMISTFKVEGDGDEIHPHLLLPLVENAVKHSSGDSRWIKVELMKGKADLALSVENSVSDRKSESDETSGLGLTNLRKRLELLYPERFALTAERDGNRFKAYLKLKLR